MEFSHISFLIIKTVSEVDLFLKKRSDNVRCNPTCTNGDSYSTGVYFYHVNCAEWMLRTRERNTNIVLVWWLNYNRLSSMIYWADTPRARWQSKYCETSNLLERSDSDGDSNNNNYIYESVFVFWKVNDGNPSSVYCSERYNFYFLSFTLLVWPLLERCDRGQTVLQMLSFHCEIK